MDRDALYYHFANLGLVIIGLLSIHAILSPFIFVLFFFGVIAGFFVSWQIKDSRPPYVDIFIGMLSLSATVILLGRISDAALTLKNLLSIFSTLLVWLTVFQSYGLRAKKSYAILQFISATLFTSSVCMALEEDFFYLIMLSLFLFILLVTMRLDLICESRQKGSLIIGDQREIFSLWQQVKISALMVSSLLILAAFIFPFLHRFENISIKKIPSTFFGIPAEVPLLKLSEESYREIEDDKRLKKELFIDDMSKEREVAGKTDYHPDEAVDYADKKSVDYEDLIDPSYLYPRGHPEARMAEGSYEILQPLRYAQGPQDEGSENTPTPHLLMNLFWLLLLAILFFLIRSIIKSKRLSELAKENPRQFIIEVYRSLCRGFKLYGIPRFDYIGHREFYWRVKGMLLLKPEPLQIMTENVLEASFSTHSISPEHSLRVLQLFQEVKGAVLERKIGKEFWKRALFRLSLFDVLLVRCFLLPNK